MLKIESNFQTPSAVFWFQLNRSESRLALQQSLGKVDVGAKPQITTFGIMSFQGKKRKFPQNLCNICLAFIIQSSPCLPYRQNVLCVGMFSQIPWAEETKRGERLCCVGTQGIWDLILHLGVTPSNPSPSIPDWQQGLFYGHALGKEMDLDFLFWPRQDRKGKTDIFSY